MIKLTEYHKLPLGNRDGELYVGRSDDKLCWLIQPLETGCAGPSAFEGLPDDAYACYGKHANGLQISVAAYEALLMDIANPILV